MPGKAHVEVGLAGGVEFGDLMLLTPADQDIPVREGLVTAEEAGVQRGVVAKVADDGGGVPGGIEFQGQPPGTMGGQV
jgi:hypothetical protein